MRSERGYAEEFQTVDLIVRSSAETRGVDAFALSLIKAERQIRKLVTHLVYQFPCFGQQDVRPLREALGKSKQVYFEGFERGFDALYPRAVKELIGAEHDRLRSRLNKAIPLRNKIFHGQLMPKYLTRDELLSYVNDIKEWCRALADSALDECGYDGFARNSFRKSHIRDLWKRYKLQFTGLRSYNTFICQHMEREPRSKQP